MAATMWEYRVVAWPRSVSSNPLPGDVENRCNELGADGWELVGTTPVLTQYGIPESDYKPNDWYMIFKRPAA